MMIMAMTIVVVVMGAVEMTIMTMVMMIRMKVPEVNFSLDLPCQSPSNSFWYTFCYTHSNSKI